jgi:small subunit ribosomal protein S1
LNSTGYNFSAMITESQSIKPGALLSQILKNEAPGNRLKEGDVVEARLIKKTPRGFFFDLGKFGTGIVYGLELLNARDIVRNLTPGASVPAKVIDLDGEFGYVELSLAEAGRQRLWQQVQELQESGEIVKMKITGANSGGLLGNILELKAFLPVSQLSNDHYSRVTADGDRQKTLEELKKFIGEELQVKVINVNPRSNKLIVSERETVTENIKELLAQYQIGQTVTGIVSGLADFGIFVKFADNPQIEGLVHISEIDHRVIDNPKEVVNIGETVKVKIIDIKDGRVFLSLKALKADPWEKAAEHFKEGDIVRGKIYKFNPFGATVDLAYGLQGVLHVSEFGDLEEMKKALPLGSEHEFTVELVKPEEKRIVLKLKK